LVEAERILNEQHFGLMKVKDRLLEFLAVIKRRKQIEGADFVPGRPARRGQDIIGAKCGRMRWTEVSPGFPSAVCVMRRRFEVTGARMSALYRAESFRHCGEWRVAIQ
jgi:ATP-dependent Lon protease